ncbi:MAG: tRNA (adenosine(37)-N6)-threonylcarbamoyltransferase complex ATPase subunit type 1 TsaE [Chloroflexi bacterium]|nr:tRNA (adenosine(37)-N6)-threonylcarbamoyltransferase complex ATPase subunit type 1 TsaE [Chloroflexota bacterium]
MTFRTLAHTQIVSDGPDATRAVGAAIGRWARPGDLVALQGELGAGKTVVAQGIAQGLGVEEGVTSPTYVLVSVYGSGRLRLQHVDLYRLAGALDLDSIDWEDLLDEPAVTAVEWSERAGERMPDDCLLVAIQAESTNRRTITLSAGGPRSRELLAAVGARMAAR